MKCPVCRATYRSKVADRAVESPDLGLLPRPVHPGQEVIEPEPSLCCHRCGVDLAPLLQIYDRALWHYHQALQHLAIGDYGAAQIQVDRALQLHHQAPEFHRLAGQLWALQGDFHRANQAWGKAQKLDPHSPIGRIWPQILAQFN
jgi:tetratricopeptide (TPR) repeat protein